jgi:hypothetical protein
MAQVGESRRIVLDEESFEPVVGILNIANGETSQVWVDRDEQASGVVCLQLQTRRQFLDIPFISPQNHGVHLQVAHDVERHSHVDAAELGVSSSIDQFFYRSVRHEWWMYKQRRNDVEDRVQSDQELV